MAKLQDYNHTNFCVMDQDLERLFYKRFRARCRVDLEHEYVTHLLMSRPEKANSLEVRVNISIKEMDSQASTQGICGKDHRKC